MNCPSGRDIPIELRPEEEIRSKFYKEQMTPAEIPCYNPAFDITDHELISGIVTEHGIAKAPYEESLKKLFL